MKEILEFLARTPAFFLATAEENGQPHVRPFAFVMEWEGKLTFVTSTAKRVYSQLLKNPRVEITSFDSKEWVWMRINGTVEFISDLDAKRRVFEIMPQLRDVYGSENNPAMICFRIAKGEAGIYSFRSLAIPERIIKI